MATVKIHVANLTYLFSSNSCRKYDAEQTTPRVSGLRQYLFFSLTIMWAV